MNSVITDNTNIQTRTKLSFFKGRYLQYINLFRNRFVVWVARRNGATIGESVTMPYKLAKNANKYLTVGNHTSIATHKIVLRRKVTIGSYVIIGDGVEILTGSHNIDSPDWEQKSYGIEIEDYCWLATKTFILPTCQIIGYGAVCGAGSVVAKSVEPMAVMSGNPAVELRKRKAVHTDLCVESMLGNDFVAYTKAYRNK